MSKLSSSLLSSSSRPHIEVCSDCSSVSRRGFIKSVGGAALAGVVGSVAGSVVSATPVLAARSAALADSKPAETAVKALFDSLKPEQRKLMCFPFDHKLRSFISNNWHVVDEEAGAVGKLYTPDQQDLIRQIFKGVTSPEGHEKFLKQMKDDAGGFEKYTCAIFGEPGTGKFEWVMTGRHLTIRADGDSVENTAFGGPIFYGHAVEFNERPDHPGNIWWHQARLANDVFKALDGKQRERALLDKAPADEDTVVRLMGTTEGIPGLPVGELGADQKGAIEKALKDMLGMYRASDVDEALACVKKNGGLDALRVSFYKEEDLGSDGIWDRWMIQGPTLVWYFRGSPHVHAWVNIASAVTEKKARI